MASDNKYLVFIILISMIFTSVPVKSEQWPQFRGSHSDNVAGSKFPESWNESNNILWKIPVKGEGWSCPIVWDDKIILTAAIRTDKENDARNSKSKRNQRRSRRDRRELLKANFQWELICLNAKTGKIDWKKTARTGHPTIPRHSSNSYATETPLTDGKRIYAYFGMTGLYCYDMQGSFQWKKDLGTFEMRADWGASSSPVLFKDKLFLQIDNEQDSFLVALETKSGDEIWRAKRNEPSQYSSPIIWKNSKRSELITVGQVCRSYDPNDGKILWELDMSKGRSSASALAVDDRLYVGTEFRNRGRDDDGGGFLFAIKPGGSGYITPKEDVKSKDHVLWKIEDSGIQMASPVVCKGHIYLFERRRGLLHCVNASNGETAYRKRISGSRAFWASPWTDGKHVYCLDDSGTTYVLASGPEFRLLGKNIIEGQSWSSPAISNGALFLRTIDHLYCISSKKDG